MTQIWGKFSTDFVAQGTTTTIGFINGDPSTDTNNGLDTNSVALSTER
jgi:hypothetical protein